MLEKIGVKKLCLFLLAVGILFLILYVVANSKISALGMTGEQYDMARDTLNYYLGSRPLQVDFFSGLLMDSRGTLLIIGILAALLGGGGLLYYHLHPEAAEKEDRKSAAILRQKQLKKQQSGGINMPQQADAPQAEKTSVADKLKSLNVETLVEQFKKPTPKLLTASVATVLFVIGIGIFPNSLFSIAAGLLLIYAVMTRSSYKAFVFCGVFALFVARYLINNSANTDFLSLLYLITCILPVVLVPCCNISGIGSWEFEEDDRVLFAFCLQWGSWLNIILALILFFSGLSLGFNIIVYRLGAVFFWTSSFLYYKESEKPHLPAKEDVYQGKQPHPYHQIGGSLLGFMVVIYVIAAALLIAGPIMMGSYINALKGIGRSNAVAAYALGKFTIYLMITLSGFMMLCGLVLLWFNRKVRVRSSQFLLYYEISAFSIVLAVAIVQFINGNVLLGLLVLIGGGALAWFVLRFLCTSVRVRTYMGSDQYLKEALFVKRFPKPEPADLPGTGEYVSNLPPQQQIPVQAYQAPKWTAQSPVTPVAQHVQSADEWELVDEPGAQNDDDEWEMVEEKTPTNLSDEWELMEEAPVQNAAYDEWEIVDEPASDFDSQPVQLPSEMRKNERPRRSDRYGCCICGGNIESEYAVLFTDEDGKEVRIDQNCRNAIYTLMQGNDSAMIQSSRAYIEAKLNLVTPQVATVLNKYLRCRRGNLSGKNLL